MNFYKHHLGDYASHTSHLTWDEDCAYRRLLDQYYRHESPIPAEIKDACRLVRAHGCRQMKAVARVLQEFFSLTSDGWIQKRCDEEIARAKEQALINQKIAEERWSRKRGINKGTNRIRTVYEPSTDTGEHRIPSQTPLAISQTPDKTLKKNTSVKKVLNGHYPDVAPQIWNDFKALRARKKAPITETAMAGIKREAEKAGISLEAALALACERGWQGFKAEWVTGDLIRDKPIDYDALIAKAKEREANAH